MFVALVPLLIFIYCALTEPIPVELSGNNNGLDHIVATGQNFDTSDSPIDTSSSGYESTSKVLDTGSDYSRTSVLADLVSVGPEKPNAGNEGCEKSSVDSSEDDAFVQRNPTEPARDIITHGVADIVKRARWCPGLNINNQESPQLAKPHRPKEPPLPALCLPSKHTLCCKPDSRISSNDGTQSPQNVIAMPKRRKREEPKHIYADCVDCKFYSPKTLKRTGIF